MTTCVSNVTRHLFFIKFYWDYSHTSSFTYSLWMLSHCSKSWGAVTKDHRSVNSKRYMPYRKSLLTPHRNCSSFSVGSLRKSHELYLWVQGPELGPMIFHQAETSYPESQNDQHPLNLSQCLVISCPESCLENSRVNMRRAWVRRECWESVLKWGS